MLFYIRVDVHSFQVKMIVISLFNDVIILLAIIVVLYKSSTNVSKSFFDLIFY